MKVGTYVVIDGHEFLLFTTSAPVPGGILARPAGLPLRAPSRPGDTHTGGASRAPRVVAGALRQPGG